MVKIIRLGEKSVSQIITVGVYHGKPVMAFKAVQPGSDHKPGDRIPKKEFPGWEHPDNWDVIIQFDTADAILRHLKKLETMLKNYRTFTKRMTDPCSP